MKVVFIMGAGHCGSTLLDLILGSHSAAFSLGEFKQFGPRSAAAGQICGVCVEECPIWRGDLNSALQKIVVRKGGFQRIVRLLTRQLRNPYRLVAQHTDKNIVIDSSKHPAWIRNRLSPAYLWHGIDPHLVYLHRDGRAVTNSYFRKYPDRTYSNVVRDWIDQVEAMETYFEAFSAGPKCRMGYEALATEPEQAARDLCHFLGLGFEPSMLRYWEHDHHHLGGNGGTRHLIFRYREQFGAQSQELQSRISESKKHYAHEYYDDTHLAIQLDERWREELTADQLQLFAQLASAVNRGYEHGATSGNSS